MKTLKLQPIHFMPQRLEPGVLYVSKEFDIAAHLCPCGCGHKVMTPLGPTEWSFEEVGGKPTLRPSIGSWQLPCQSHYWIIQGEIRWAEQWTPAQIEAGRRAEEQRRRAHFDSLERRWRQPHRRIWRWLKKLFF